MLKSIFILSTIISILTFVIYAAGFADDPVDTTSQAIQTNVTEEVPVTNQSVVIKRTALPAVKTRQASAVPDALSSASFIFPDNSALFASPRKPLFITLVISTKSAAKTASVKFYAGGISNGVSGEIFILRKMIIVNGRGQTQFYWTAKKTPIKYFPKGSYYIYAVVQFYDMNGNVLSSIKAFPEPRNSRLVTIN